MKILLIGPVPPDLGSYNTGGIARHVWALANQLKDRGHEVSVLAIGRYFKRNHMIDGIKVFGLQKIIKCLGLSLINAPGMFAEIGFIPQKKSYLHAFYSLFRINAVDDLNDYDVIHLHGLHNVALYPLKVLGIAAPKIVSIHSYTDYISSDKAKSVKKMRYVRNYLTLSDGIVHVSNADRKKGRQYGLVLETKNKVIHNGVEKGGNCTFDCKLGVCFVGYLIQRKRISLFLESIKYSKSDIKEVNIAGDGSLRQEVEKAAELNPIISYRGIIPNEEVRKMMNEFSLLVVPSLSESFGLVYIEALFEGMAVLGYAPVIEEFQEEMDLTDDEKKLVVPIPPKKISAEALARQIDATFEFRQTGRGKEAMKSVQKKAIQNFEWNSVINKMTDLYCHVIKQ